MAVINQSQASKQAGVSRVAIMKLSRKNPLPSFFVEQGGKFKIDADHPGWLEYIGKQVKKAELIEVKKLANVKKGERIPVKEVSKKEPEGKKGPEQSVKGEGVPKPAKKGGGERTAKKGNRGPIDKENEKHYICLAYSEFGVKIGRTNNINKRHNEIAFKLPFKIIKTEYFEVENMYYLETKLHKIYKAYRKNGEWFDLNQNQINEIHGIIAEYEVNKELTGEKLPEKPKIFENIDNIVLTKNMTSAAILEYQELFKARKLQEEVSIAQLKRREKEKALIDVEMGSFLFMGFIEQFKVELALVPGKQDAHLESYYKSGQNIKAQQLLKREFSGLLERISRDQAKALKKWKRDGKK